jgi:hypothetical protein
MMELGAKLEGYFAKKRFCLRRMHKPSAPNPAALSGLSREGESAARCATADVENEYRMK